MIDDPDTLFKQLSHGVYVIGVNGGERRNAFTAAWVMQVSFDPPMLCFSINPAHYSYRLLRDSDVCTVNVLGKEQLPLAAHFGRAGVPDKMAGFDWTVAVTGAPVLSSAAAYFDCRVSHYSEAGDHVLAVCHVVAGRVLRTGPLLLYGDTGDLDGSRELYPAVADISGNPGQ